MITLRPYQEEPVRKAIEYFRQNDPEPALMVCPTGWGKSLLAAECAAACPDPILVVQPTKELLEQNLEKYRLLCGDLAPAGVYSASFGKKDIDHVTFATIGSIKGVGAEFRRLGFRKMLIDEAHLYPRKEQSMLGQFLKDSGIRQVLGITATPLKLESFSEKQGERFDKWSTLTMLTNPSPDGSFFKRILHVSQIREMTESGFWAPLKYEIVPYERSLLALNAAGSEYSEKSVVTAYEANNIRQNILAALDWHRERQHVLVFVPSVEEAAQLAAIIPGAAALSGETPKKERAETVRLFKEGALRVLVNVNVLAVGFNYPGIDMVVLAAPTASVARYYQATGRGVRTAQGKADCLVVDMAGCHDRFGSVEDITFESDGRWRMYGTGGRLLSGIPVSCMGDIRKRDVVDAQRYRGYMPALAFGKHKGKRVDEAPVSYMIWYLKHGGDAAIKNSMLLCLEDHVRDTRCEAPVTVLPDGKYAGCQMWTVPRGYLQWYYGSKEWNETNDSVRRGVEMILQA